MKTIFILFLFLVGCSRVAPLSDEAVKASIATYIDKDVSWGSQGSSHVVCLLQEPITLERSVQIALLNNPKIQAEFEKMGIAHADLYQAGLINNPIFSLAYRPSTFRQLATDIEFSIFQNIVSLLLRKTRTKVAALEFEKIEKEVTFAILDLAFDVERTFIALSKEMRIKESLKEIVEIAEIKALIAEEQFAKGNANALTLLHFTKSAEDKKAIFVENAIQIQNLTYKLEQLLGVCHIPLKIIPLEDHPPSISSLSRELEELALQRRQDYQAALLDLEKMAFSMGLKAPWVYTDFALGFSLEKEDSPNTVRGPAIAAEIPIFDFGQAARCRIKAEYFEKLFFLNSLKIQIVSNVAAKYLEHETLCIIALNLRKELLEKEIQENNPTEELYNVMGLSIYDLLEQKLEDFEEAKRYIEAWAACATAYVDLIETVGGKI